MLLPLRVPVFLVARLLRLPVYSGLPFPAACQLNPSTACFLSSVLFPRTQSIYITTTVLVLTILLGFFLATNPNAALIVQVGGVLFCGSDVVRVVLSAGCYVLVWSVLELLSFWA